jgi:hypothetical protein
VFKDLPEQIEVLNHCGKNLTAKDTKNTKKCGGIVGVNWGIINSLDKNYMFALVCLGFSFEKPK